jgi:ParB-like chromosome segregation protein Spo0J
MVKAATPKAEPAAQVEAPAATPVAKYRVFDSTSSPVVKIQISAIRMNKPDPLRRTFSKDNAERIAKSIESEGLIHPPIVTDHGDGTYEPVAGMHRLYAVKKILGWTEVPCFILQPGDDDLAEQIEIATNLFVQPLSEPQCRLAVQRWREIFVRKNPEKTTRGTERKRDGFASQVAGALGVSESQAQRIATTAKVISPEDRQLLESAGTSQTSIDEIAQLREPEAVAAAVALTAAGKPVEEAIRHGKKCKADAKTKKTPVKADAPEPAAKPAKASEMTDDEWLAAHCGRVLEALPYKNAFRRDAVLYRRMIESIVKLRGAAKKPLAEAKKPAENGSFYANLYRIVRTSHPMNWLICEKCDGHGHDKADKSKVCGVCLGGGYKVKFEEA